MLGRAEPTLKFPAAVVLNSSRLEKALILSVMSFDNLIVFSAEKGFEVKVGSEPSSVYRM